MGKKLKPIHPFPARMAPGVALDACKAFRNKSIILDPMCGSGTVLRAASEAGHLGIGLDVDPLAILLTKVWTTPINIELLNVLAKEAVKKAKLIPDREVCLPWIDNDIETQSFIEYWFDSPQKRHLRKLAYVLYEMEGDYGDVLRIALSRIIITKKIGASLAGDISHSRPHRIRTENNYRVFEGFEKAISYISKRLNGEKLQGKIEVKRGDSRQINLLKDNSIDAIITSPPYLNAIDYLRGHKLSLVWLGYTIKTLRSIRSNSVGTERVVDPNKDLVLAQRLTNFIDKEDRLPKRRRKMIDRYALDTHSFMKAFYRVLKPSGKIVLVIGDSCHKNVYVENSKIVVAAAQDVGFRFVGQRIRDIPPSRRYLPPPSQTEVSQLQNRMRVEAVQVFVKQ